RARSSIHCAARQPGSAAKSKPIAPAPSRACRRSTHVARLPCGSMSSKASRAPCRAHATASCAASVVLPAPPLRCAIVITNPGIDPALAEIDARGHPSFLFRGLEPRRQAQALGYAAAIGGVRLREMTDLAQLHRLRHSLHGGGNFVEKLMPGTTLDRSNAACSTSAK